MGLPDTIGTRHVLGKVNWHLPENKLINIYEPDKECCHLGHQRTMWGAQYRSWSGSSEYFELFEAGVYVRHILRHILRRIRSWLARATHHPRPTYWVDHRRWMKYFFFGTKLGNEHISGAGRWLNSGFWHRGNVECEGRISEGQNIAAGMSRVVENLMWLICISGILYFPVAAM